jgi:hypothetical protein
MWKILSGLVFLVMIQFIINIMLLSRLQHNCIGDATYTSYLISDNNNDFPRSIQTKNGIPQNETVQVASSKEKSAHTDLSSHIKKITYDGVAATLMINSPKWFQRRYTFMINNMLANIPETWALQIFYAPVGQSQLGLEINPGILRLNATMDRVILTEIPVEMIQKLGMKRKFYYWTSEWMWDSMVAERVLVFSGNGAICGNANISLLDGSALALLTQFDYIGTPWRNLYGIGGDGSISYRNATAMRNAIKWKAHDGKTSEDYYFIQTLNEMNLKSGTNYRIASKEQTQLFGGISDKLEDNDAPPFVIAGTMPRLNHDVRNLVLEMCPEVKTIFPALHNPNCFGAHPNAEECSKHICALSDPKFRPSGC